jgi:hypothetical protein
VPAKEKESRKKEKESKEKEKESREKEKESRKKKKEKESRKKEKEKKMGYFIDDMLFKLLLAAQVLPFCHSCSFFCILAHFNRSDPK